ncbi:hypothetical protein AX14_003970 [Amanita brunnescens Koide BX004]|nr:hypothetical protein AX14_003970 [Amanita brunnescens Koide BX004]
MLFNCRIVVLFSVSCAALGSLLADSYSTQTDLASHSNPDTMLTYRSRPSEQQLGPRILSARSSEPLGSPFHSEEYGPGDMFPIEFDSDQGHNAISQPIPLKGHSNSENPIPRLTSPEIPFTPEFNDPHHVPSPHTPTPFTVDPKNLESHALPAASALSDQGHDASPPDNNQGYAPPASHHQSPPPIDATLALILESYPKLTKEQLLKLKAECEASYIDVARKRRKSPQVYLRQCIEGKLQTLGFTKLKKKKPSLKSPQPVFSLLPDELRAEFTVECQKDIAEKANKKHVTKEKYLEYCINMMAKAQGYKVKIPQVRCRKPPPPPQGVPPESCAHLTADVRLIFFSLSLDDQTSNKNHSNSRLFRPGAGIFVEVFASNLINVKKNA